MIAIIPLAPTIQFFNQPLLLQLVAMYVYIAHVADNIVASMLLSVNAKIIWISK